eukprot:GHVS01074030.1.p1 GENE.GHVS01074030.1~~GHVS01074030.1.p1  ORF type:complete len:120 (-),score=25.06 GHVS01074030.1:164-523(-)
MTERKTHTTEIAEQKKRKRSRKKKTTEFAVSGGPRHTQRFALYVPAATTAINNRIFPLLFPTPPHAPLILIPSSLFSSYASSSQPSCFSFSFQQCEDISFSDWPLHISDERSSCKFRVT